MIVSLPLAADLLVAVLLVATIVTSLRLSRRMTAFKADETGMRATIADLVAATDRAERAIAGLKTTLAESDQTLGEKLRAAERYSAELTSQVSASQAVMTRVARIAEVSRKAAAATGTPRLDATGSRRETQSTRLLDVASAARDIADRAAKRAESRAA